MLRRNENRKEVNGTEDQYSDSALLNSPESDGRRVKSTGDEASPPQASQQRLGPEDPSVFFSRPVKVRKNRGYPLNNGAVRHSVFKRAARRRREEVRGAEEVSEDENTATELPIDQRVAETVEDEEHDTAEPLDNTVQGMSSRIHDKQVTGKEAENIRDSSKPEQRLNLISSNSDPDETISKSTSSTQERQTKSPRTEQVHYTEDMVRDGVVLSS